MTTDETDCHDLDSGPISHMKWPDAMGGVS